MARAYSIDLRERVVEYVSVGGSRVSASRLFKVSRPTINKWLEYQKHYKDLRPKKARGRRSTICAAELKSYIDEHSDQYLREIAGHFNVSYVAIHDACRRYGISRKKNHAVSGKE